MRADFFLTILILAFISLSKAFDPSVCFLQTSDDCLFVQSAQSCNGQTCQFTPKGLAGDVTGDPERGLSACTQKAFDGPLICDNQNHTPGGANWQYGCACGAALSQNAFASQCAGRCDSSYTLLAANNQTCNLAFSPGQMLRGNYTGDSTGACLTAVAQNDQDTFQVIDSIGLTYDCTNTVQSRDNIDYICSCLGPANAKQVNADGSDLSDSCNLAAIPDGNSYNISLPSRFKLYIEGYSAIKRPTKGKGGDAVQILLSAQGGDANTLTAGFPPVNSQLSINGPKITQEECSLYPNTNQGLIFELAAGKYMSFGYRLLSVEDGKMTLSQAKGEWLRTANLLGPSIAYASLWQPSLLL